MKSLVAKVKSVSGLSNFIRRNPLYYSGQKRQLGDLLAGDLEYRKRWTTARLRKLLRKASMTAYGKKVGAGDRIESWPILSKEQLLAEPASFKTRGWGVSAATSGTTGAPLPLVRAPGAVCFEQVCIDLLMERADIDPRRDRIVVLRGDTIKPLDELRPPYWRYDSSGRKMYLSAHHLSPETAADYIAELSKFAPACIMAYPSAAEALARLVRSSNGALPVKLVMTSSEMLAPVVRNMVQETFSCRVIDHYGQGERVALAYSEQIGKYYFLPGYGYVELLPAKSSGSPDVYEVVATSLWNTAMPLVRYKTGDLIRCSDCGGDGIAEPVAYGMGAFESVDGRQSDYLLSPNGARLIGMNQVPRDLDNVVRLQLIQEAVDLVRILVIPGERFSDADREHIRCAIYAKIPESMSIQIEIVDEVELTGQAKAPLVVRRPIVERQDLADKAQPADG